MSGKKEGRGVVFLIHTLLAAVIVLNAFKVW